MASVGIYSLQAVQFLSCLGGDDRIVVDLCLNWDFRGSRLGAGFSAAFVCLSSNLNSSSGNLSLEREIPKYSDMEDGISTEFVS